MVDTFSVIGMKHPHWHACAGPSLPGSPTANLVVWTGYQIDSFPVIGEFLKDTVLGGAHAPDNPPDCSDNKVLGQSFFYFGGDAQNHGPLHWTLRGKAIVRLNVQ